MAIKHVKVVTTPDDGTSDVGTDEWNDNHTIDNGTITNDQLSATGTKDSSTYLRGDGAWSQISGIPAGVILMWSGTLANIPAGWNLCDGNNGTPNLIAKFVRSIQTASTEAGSTGGSDAVTLTGAESGLPAHNHTVNNVRYNGNTGNGIRTANPSQGATYTVYTSTSTATNASSSHENRPAYFELAYIMKA
jgi:hypothetical protein